MSDLTDDSVVSGPPAPAPPPLEPFVSFVQFKREGANAHIVVKIDPPRLKTMSWNGKFTWAPLSDYTLGRIVPATKEMFYLDPFGRELKGAKKAEAYATLANIMARDELPISGTAEDSLSDLQQQLENVQEEWATIFAEAELDSNGDVIDEHVDKLLRSLENEQKRLKGLIADALRPRREKRRLTELAVTMAREESDLKEDPGVWRPRRPLQFDGTKITYSILFVDPDAEDPPNTYDVTVEGHTFKYHVLYDVNDVDKEEVQLLGLPLALAATVNDPDRSTEKLRLSEKRRLKDKRRLIDTAVIRAFKDSARRGRPARLHRADLPAFRSLTSRAAAAAAPAQASARTAHSSDPVVESFEFVDNGKNVLYDILTYKRRGTEPPGLQEVTVGYHMSTIRYIVSNGKVQLLGPIELGDWDTRSAVILAYEKYANYDYIFDLPGSEESRQKREARPYVPRMIERLRLAVNNSAYTRGATPSAKAVTADQKQRVADTLKKYRELSEYWGFEEIYKRAVDMYVKRELWFDSEMSSFIYAILYYSNPVDELPISGTADKVGAGGAGANALKSRPEYTTLLW